MYFLGLQRLLLALLLLGVRRPAALPNSRAGRRLSLAEGGSEPRLLVALGDDRVLLSRKAKEGLARWAKTLRSDMADGVPLAHGVFPAFNGADCGAIYADASGLECLAGALYVSDGDRCRALLAALAAIGGGGDDEAPPT